MSISRKSVLPVLLAILMIWTMIPAQGVFAADTNPFKDVPSNAFYYDAVLWAVNHDPQITNGTSADAFDPDETCTRGQVVTFLWRAMGKPKPTSPTNPFTDVKENFYYYDAVLWAVEKGITAGTSRTTFSPDEGCKRGQVVTFLHRAAGEPPAGSAANPFQDVADNAYYYNAVLWAVTNKVTAGTGATTFSPDDTCTRGQIVTFLYRAKDLLAGDDLSDEEIEKEIETTTDLNQDLAEMESAYIITDNAQETADHAEAVMQEMLDYCDEQKEAGAIVDYELDGCLLIIHLKAGTFVYEFQLFPGLQGSSSGSTETYCSHERAAGSSALTEEKARLLSDSSEASGIITIEPFKEQFNTDLYDNAAKAIENAGLGYAFIRNADSEEVTVELAKSLNDYKVIIWNGHGSFSDSNGMHSILGLGEICTKDNFKKYKEDFKENRMVWFGNVKSPEDAYGKVHYGVTTKFFDYYYDPDSLNDSLIFLGACCSAEDSYLEQTFIDKGAEAVLGYSNPVHPDYNQAMFKTLFEQLIIKDNGGNTRTIKQALEAAKETNGERDPNWVSVKQAILEMFSTVPWTKLSKEHAELVLKEKDADSYRLSDYGGNVQGGHTGTVALDKANVGDYVTFGHYEQDSNLDNGKEPIEWKVLDKKNGRLLVISKYGLDYKKYHESREDITWENCTMRSWLNSTFLNDAFTGSEKEAIPTVTLSNPDNPVYGTEGGNDTQDRVFLLSIQELEQYFNISEQWTDYDGHDYDTSNRDYLLGGSRDAIASATDYAVAQGAYRSSAYHDAEGIIACAWSLRSPGNFNTNVAYVGPSSEIDVLGSGFYYHRHAIRPALWIETAAAS